MTPIIPFFSVLLISLMSFKEDTPPDIIIGILVFSAKANVSSNAGPIKIPLILKKLKEGFNVGLVTDAGTPLISDPGYKLIKKALDNNIIVKSVPGPSALTAAISISGISTDQFMFSGFLPRKASLRNKKLSSLANLESSIVIFENATRMNKLLIELSSKGKQSGRTLEIQRLIG